MNARRIVYLVKSFPYNQIFSSLQIPMILCVFSSPPNWPAISRLYILFLEFSLFSSVRDIIQCIYYSAQCTSNTVKCTVYTLKFTVWSLQCTAIETVPGKVSTSAWTVL